MAKSLLTGTVQNIIDDAIHEELYAAQLYRHLSNQCNRLGLFGAAKYFANESSDELTHYQKWADYLNDRGSVATLPETPAFDNTIPDIKAALEAAYDAEKALGDKYIAWYKQVFPIDPMTANFMLFSLDKQMTSIGEYNDLLQRLALGGDILVFDQEMGGE